MNLCARKQLIIPVLIGNIVVALKHTDKIRFAKTKRMQKYRIFTYTIIIEVFNGETLIYKGLLLLSK